MHFGRAEPNRQKKKLELEINELEEMRTSVEQAERARKTAESELHEAADHIGEISTSNANLQAQKRKVR